MAGIGLLRFSKLTADWSIALLLLGWWLEEVVAAC